MKTLIVAAILSLLVACGSDTGDTTVVCEKAYPNKCPLPGAPTSQHYGPIHK